MFGYGVDKSAYNLGIKRNFQEVFGTKALLWIFPIFTSGGDGMSYSTMRSFREYKLLQRSDFDNHKSYSDSESLAFSESDPDDNDDDNAGATQPLMQIQIV
jgi:hypothetical protein